MKISLKNWSESRSSAPMELAPAGTAAHAAYEATCACEETEAAYAAVHGAPDPRWKNYFANDDGGENPEAAVLNEEIRDLGVQIGMAEDDLQDMRAELSELKTADSSSERAAELETAIANLEAGLSRANTYYTRLREKERELLAQ